MSLEDYLNEAGRNVALVNGAERALRMAYDNSVAAAGLVKEDGGLYLEDLDLEANKDKLEALKASMSADLKTYVTQFFESGTSNNFKKSLMFKSLFGFDESALMKFIDGKKGKFTYASLEQATAEVFTASRKAAYTANAEEYLKTPDMIDPVFKYLRLDPDKAVKDKITPSLMADLIYTYKTTGLNESMIENADWYKKSVVEVPGPSAAAAPARAYESEDDRPGAGRRAKYTPKPTE